MMWTVLTTNKPPKKTMIPEMSAEILARHIEQSMANVPEMRAARKS